MYKWSFLENLEWWVGMEQLKKPGSILGKVLGLRASQCTAFMTYSPRRQCRGAADRDCCAFAGRSSASWECPNDRTFLLTESTCTVAGWFTKRNICSHRRITDVRTTPGNYSLNEKCVRVSAWETSLGRWGKGVDGDYVNKYGQCEACGPWVLYDEKKKVKKSIWPVSISDHCLLVGFNNNNQSSYYTFLRATHWPHNTPAHLHTLHSNHLHTHAEPETPTACQTVLKA